ncbi:hypothetical protein CH275_12140 [Rhodococcus sp. 06-235-1A]|uniref:hypothetical protein n=1 Tax=Rhodococcus sp. 06-235-1A TaxID=2022508 RepID=UPI000B9A9FAF|nr:hypothetical protein [Rhodococcus sp. 06-235-1A]OZD05114.1 hypothetical protein CH275_12140 [Rhodococcus sp. 06-235-1A]
MLLRLHAWLHQLRYLTRSLIAGTSIAGLGLAAILLVANKDNILKWDLTQPQGVLIAGLISGPFLIAAAYLAFHGQKEMRQEERRKFDEQMKFERRKFTETLAEQRYLSDQQILRALDQQKAQLDAEWGQHQDLLQQQRNQHRSQMSQLKKSLKATKAIERRRLLSTAEIEEKKHRRQVVFTTIGDAMKSLVDIRATFVAINKAIDDDKRISEEAESFGMEVGPEEELKALARCTEASDQVTASASMLLLIELEDSYEALMAVVQYVGTRAIHHRGEPMKFADIHEFGIIWTAAINSLRGKYKQA